MHGALRDFDFGSGPTGAAQHAPPGPGKAGAPLCVAGSYYVEVGAVGTRERLAESLVAAAPAVLGWVAAAARALRVVLVLVMGMGACGDGGDVMMGPCRPHAFGLVPCGGGAWALGTRAAC